MTVVDVSGAGLCGTPVYRDPSHAGLPHVVKMSGGRSSAAMVLALARGGVLLPARGDVVLFANTTAEHPATYEFASRVCDELEGAHGVPCFWFEFCTVEDVSVGHRGWRRKASYRLVRRRAAEPNDDPAVPGFRSDGSAFEALASLKTMLPNRHVRICTRHLKTLPGASLVSEWLSGGPGPAHAGHHHGKRLRSVEDAADDYSGAMPRERFVDLHAACHRIDPECRPQQNWQSFTRVQLNRPTGGPRRKADIYGKAGRPVRYVSLLGLRADEPDRVRSMEHRAFMAEGATTSACRDASQPAGEMPYAPLSDHEANVGDVRAFWASQPYDLRIDSGLGNCVYCFMKGEKQLRRQTSLPDEYRQSGQPTHIDWWEGIERRYARDARGGKFKFLSLSSVTYADIRRTEKPVEHSASVSFSPDVRLPCECSD